MTNEALGYLNKLLTDLGINYEFGEWTGKLVYPYFVGEYEESEAINEDGMQESLFILNGFTRNNWIDLFNVKSIVEKNINVTDILSNGNGIAVMYSNSLVIPTGDAELKRIQINLKIKEWKV